MARPHYIRTPNESIIATALKLCNTIIAQGGACFSGHNSILCEKNELLIKLKSISEDRKRAFPGIKFADPYWNIIVGLAVDFENKENTSIKAACISSGVPTTTALRCLRELEDVGVLRRLADPTDGRRVFVRLTEQSKLCLDAWLRSSLLTVGLIEPSDSALNYIDIGSSSDDF